MLLKLYSIKDDLLELAAESVRPNIKIAEIFYDGEWHPWHGTWEPLKITKFDEDFKVVRDKLIQYYKSEKSSCSLENGATIRKPGHALLLTDYGEEWRLGNCKISECNIDENNESVILELSFDEVSYKTNMEKV